MRTIRHSGKTAWNMVSADAAKVDRAVVWNSREWGKIQVSTNELVDGCGAEMRLLCLPSLILNKNWANI